MVVFKILNKVTGQHYVGSCRGDIFERWELYARAADAGLDFPLYSEIRELGEDKFSIAELDFTEDREELKEIELFHTIELKARSLRSYKFGMKDAVVKRCTKTELDQAWMKELSAQILEDRNAALGVKNGHGGEGDTGLAPGESVFDDSDSVAEFPGEGAEPLSEEPEKSQKPATPEKPAPVVDTGMSATASADRKTTVNAGAKADQKAEQKERVAAAEPEAPAPKTPARAGDLLSRAFSSSAAALARIEAGSRPAGVGRQSQKTTPVAAVAGRNAVADALIPNATSGSIPQAPAQQPVQQLSQQHSQKTEQQPGQQALKSAEQSGAVAPRREVESAASIGVASASAETDSELEKAILAEGIGLLVRTLGTADKLSGFRQQALGQASVVAEALSVSEQAMQQLNRQQQLTAEKARLAAQAAEAAQAANRALSDAHQRARSCSAKALAALEQSADSVAEVAQLQNDLRALLGRLRGGQGKTTPAAGTVSSGGADVSSANSNNNNSVSNNSVSNNSVSNNSVSNSSVNNGSPTAEQAAGNAAGFRATASSSEPSVSAAPAGIQRALYSAKQPQARAAACPTRAPMSGPRKSATDSPTAPRELSDSASAGPAVAQHPLKQTLAAVSLPASVSPVSTGQSPTRAAATPQSSAVSASASPAVPSVAAARSDISEAGPGKTAQKGAGAGSSPSERSSAESLSSEASKIQRDGPAEQSTDIARKADADLIQPPAGGTDGLPTRHQSGDIAGLVADRHQPVAVPEGVEMVNRLKQLSQLVRPVDDTPAGPGSSRSAEAPSATSEADTESESLPTRRARAWVAPLEAGGKDAQIVEQSAAAATVVRRRSKRVAPGEGERGPVHGLKAGTAPDAAVSTEAPQLSGRRKLSIRSRQG